MMRGHGDAVLSISVDWASRRALTGSHDCHLKLWDLDHCLCVATMKSDDHPAFCLSADWSAGHALTGSWDRGLRLWNLERFEQAGELVDAHDKDVVGVALNWRARRAVSAGKDGMLKL